MLQAISYVLKKNLVRRKEFQNQTLWKTENYFSMNDDGILIFLEFIALLIEQTYLEFNLMLFFKYRFFFILTAFKILKSSNVITLYLFYFFVGIWHMVMCRAVNA